MDAEIIIKWGFIGCGEVTEKKSGPAFSLVPGSKIEAVMSRNKEKARSYAERHGIPKWYTDAQELVDDPDVNAVYIATPPSSHATFAIMAMKAGKPAYIEKPMAHQPCLPTNGCTLLRGLLPALPALLCQSKGTDTKRSYRTGAQCTDPVCRPTA